MPGFAHANHYYASLAGQEQFAGSGEIGADARQQSVYRIALETNGALRRLDEIEILAHVRLAWGKVKGEIITAKRVLLITCIFDIVRRLLNSCPNRPSQALGPPPSAMV
ncbi:hypothetical protein D9M73_220480 [compost metagenome]